MSEYPPKPIDAFLARLNAAIGSPETVIALCYATGLAVERLLGEGLAGEPLLVVGFPLALGLLLRFGRELGAVDVAALAIAHGVVAALHGEAANLWIWALLRDLVAITCGSLIFARLRAAKWLVSASRVGLAGALVAAAAPFAALAADLMRLAVIGDATLGAAALHLLAGFLGSILVLNLVLSYGRGFGQIATLDPGDDEPAPGRWEYVAASLALAGLAAALVHGARLEPALGASFVMLWFAMRLGLFATTAAAFALTACLLAFSPAARWSGFLDGADPLNDEFFRYLALVLLAAPGVVAATLAHDQTRMRRLYAYRSRHDGLTSLVNRSRFTEVLDAAAAGARGRGKRFALLLIDLDNFKTVNDTYGHARGDALLIKIATRLRDSTRVTDVVARIGGDEFAIIAPVPSEADAISLAKRLVETVNTPCEVEGVTLRPSITLGGVLAPEGGVEARDLMLRADGALYEAKRAGRNCWRFAAGCGLHAPIWRPNDAQAECETVCLD